MSLSSFEAFDNLIIYKLFEINYKISGTITRTLS